jgi:hypothetical protein
VSSGVADTDAVPVMLADALETTPVVEPIALAVPATLAAPFPSNVTDADVEPVPVTLPVPG